VPVNCDCCTSLLTDETDWQTDKTSAIGGLVRIPTYTTYFRQIIAFFVRTRVSVCWEASEITVFCQQFCLSWNYKVVFVHRSGELDSFNTHCSALTVRICISNSSNVYAWGQKWPRLRRQYDSLYYCYKWLYVFLYHKKLRCLLYLLMYILYKLNTAIAAKLTFTDTNDSISRQSVTAVFAAAAIITLCSRPLTDNAGVRLHLRRMADTPSSHSCAACKTAFDMCCILLSSALSRAHVASSTSSQRCGQSHHPAMRTRQSLQWWFLIGVRISVYADVSRAVSWNVQTSDHGVA